MNVLALVLVSAVLLVAAPSQGTELVYTPINPSFGGNPLNGTFLLSQASAQNSFKESSPLSTSAGAGDADPIAQFTTQLNRMLLNGLADKLIQEAFGTAALTSGDYTMGTMKVHVDATTDPTNMNVTITNIATGSTTSIAIPVYQ